MKKTKHNQHSRPISWSNFIVNGAEQTVLILFKEPIVLQNVDKLLGVNSVALNKNTCRYAL